MSSLPERSEKRCLNCESLIHGRFCQVCGQENSDHHLGFWQMVKHFIFDIFHFDGKFFSTLKKLFTRPGSVSKEFIEGKRVSNLDPVKMYVFTSAIFFLLFFKLYQPNVKTSTATEKTPVASQVTAGSATNRSFVNGFDIAPYTSLEAFDSAQNKLPANQKLGGIKRLIIRKAVYLHTHYGFDGYALAMAFINDFIHRLPQAMFVTLPLFALLLKLLYARRKQWLYFEHVIFSIHIFVTGFTCILLSLLFQRLSGWMVVPFIGSLQVLPVLALMLYLYLAMRLFYGQSWGKTLLKCLLLLFSGACVLASVIVVFAFISLIYL